MITLPRVRLRTSDLAGTATQALARYLTPLCELAAHVKADISLLPLARIQLARPDAIDGAARRNPSQSGVLIDINVNNSGAACRGTNKHVNNASTRPDVLDKAVLGGDGKVRDTHYLNFCVCVYVRKHSSNRHCICNINTKTINEC